MTDEQLKKLCANWRKSAKWFRGKGFTFNTETTIASRHCTAEALEQCAKELARSIRKAKK